MTPDERTNAGWTDRREGGNSGLDVTRFETRGYILQICCYVMLPLHKSIFLCFAIPHCREAGSKSPFSSRFLQLNMYLLKLLFMLVVYSQLSHLEFFLFVHSGSVGVFCSSWPLMTSEDAQSLRALWKSSKEPSAG